MNSANPAIMLLILRLFLGGVFVYAGAIKAWDPALFSVDVQNYRLLPYSLAVGTAIYLPWLEIICGAGLATRKFYSGALSILLGLMMVFTAAVASAWARGLDVSCGCFGGGGEGAHYPWIVLRDLVLLGLLILLALVEFRPDKRTADLLA